MATSRPTPRNPSGHKPEQYAPRTFGYSQKNVSFVANGSDALRFRTRIVRRGPRPRGLEDASRCLNMPLRPLSSLLNIFQILSRYVEARTNTRVWSYGSAGRPAISLRNTFIPNSSGRLSARSGSLAHFFTVSSHVIAQKMVITNRWYVSCHLNSVPLCCRPTVLPSRRPLHSLTVPPRSSPATCSWRRSSSPCLASRLPTVAAITRGTSPAASECSIASVREVSFSIAVGNARMAMSCRMTRPSACQTRDVRVELVRA